MRVGGVRYAQEGGRAEVGEWAEGRASPPRCFHTIPMRGQQARKGALLPPPREEAQNRGGEGEAFLEGQGQPSPTLHRVRAEGGAERGPGASGAASPPLLLWETPVGFPHKAPAPQNLGMGVQPRENKSLATPVRALSGQP